MKPPISESILRAAYCEAAVPVKSLTPHSVDVWEAVVNLKAAEQAKHGVERAWEDLRTVIDKAFSDGSIGVMNELANAQQRAKAAVVRRWTIQQDGHTEIHLTQGALNNELSNTKPRRPVTLAIIEAIERLQREHNRAPERQEILTSVGKARSDGLGEDELSKQLTKLGWNDLLS